MYRLNERNQSVRKELKRKTINVLATIGFAALIVLMASPAAQKAIVGGL